MNVYLKRDLFSFFGPDLLESLITITGIHIHDIREASRVSTVVHECMYLPRKVYGFFL